MEKNHCNDRKFAANEKRSAADEIEGTSCVCCCETSKESRVYCTCMSHACAHKTNYFSVLHFEVSTPPTGCKKEARVMIARFTIAYFVSLWYVNYRHSEKRDHRTDRNFIPRSFEILWLLPMPFPIRITTGEIPSCDIAISAR